MDVDLLPSEQVRWQGKPARYPLFEHVDRVFVPIWCFVAAVFVFVMSSGPPARDTVISRAFPVLMVLVLVWAPVARYGLRQRTLRSTEYTITDQRFVITSKPFGSRQEQSIYLAQVAPPVVRHHSDGHGSITFGEPPYFGTVPGSRPPIALEWIPDVDHVRDLIIAAQPERH